MATSDLNGLPRFQGSDPADLEGSLNLLSAATSNALDGLLLPHLVANATARNNLATAKPPTTQTPLLVWRQDLGYFQFNSGDGWRRWPLSQDVSDLMTKAIPGPNELIINGKTYQASGSWEIKAGNIKWLSTKARPTYALIKKSLPYVVPSGWRPEVFMLRNPSRYTVAWAASISTVSSKTQVSIKILQLNTTTKTGMTVGWRLTKQ